MLPQYYIVVNNLQEGPFSKEDLKSKNLTPSTLIWREGLPQWVKLENFPELADLLVIDVIEETSGYAAPEDNGWYAMLGNRRIGPATVAEIIAAGASPDTPVWHAGMADWARASTQRDFVEKFNPNTPPGFGQQNPGNTYPNFGNSPKYEQQPNFTQNPQYGQQPNFAQNPQYGQQPNFSQNPQYGRQPNYGQNPFNNNRQFETNPLHTNWLPWAIGATIVGFLFSCFGAIFGIIGIIQANKANSLYQTGFEAEGDQANSTAKTMTIIGYVLASVGLMVSGFMFRSGGLYSYL